MKKADRREMDRGCGEAQRTKDWWRIERRMTMQKYNRNRNLFYWKQQKNDLLCPNKTTKERTRKRDRKQEKINLFERKMTETHKDQKVE